MLSKKTKVKGISEVQTRATTKVWKPLEKQAIFAR